MHELNCISPRRAEEMANSPTLATTMSVRAKLSKTDFQDGIFSIDVGFADMIARTLFPGSPHLQGLWPDNSSDVNPGERSTIVLGSNIGKQCICSVRICQIILIRIVRQNFYLHLLNIFE